MKGIAGDVVGPANWSGRWRLRAEVHEHSAAARAVACFDIIQDVAHEPRAFELDVKLICGLQQHARFWLAAGALDRELGHDALRVVGAVVYTMKLYAQTVQLSREMLVHQLKVGVCEQPAREAGLICDERKEETVPLERTQLGAEPLVQDQFVGAGGVVACVDERAVPVQKEGRLTHCAHFLHRWLAYARCALSCFMSGSPRGTLGGPSGSYSNHEHATADVYR